MTRMSRTGAAAVDISFVLPCLDEEKGLPISLASAHAALTILRDRFGMRGEIIVADNGSADSSRDIAMAGKARVIEVARRGYGAAIRQGCAVARGRFLIMGDADGSYDFRDSLPMVERLLAGDDLCVGSRFKGEILPGAMPWKNRFIGNPVLSGVLNIFFNTKVSDAHCGLRAFTREAFTRLAPTADGMEFASEMVIKARLLGMRMSEVPITLHPDARDHGSHLRPWRDGWRHLRLLLMLSPGGLFLLPSLLLLLVGAPIFALLLGGHDGAIARLGTLHFGDHWMVASAAMLNVSAQLGIFGLATTLLGIRAGYRRPGGIAAAILSHLALEYFLVIGTILVVLGIAIVGHIIGIWREAHYGSLTELRPLIAGATFILLGLQLVFGGFFIGIVNGNAAEIDLNDR